jgi:hypothetical protein
VAAVYAGKRVLDENWMEPTDKQIEALVADKEKLAVIRRRLANVSSFMSAIRTMRRRGTP